MNPAASSSVAIAACGLGGGLLLPRPSHSWRTLLRYAADVAGDSRAIDVSPAHEASLDDDYFEAGDEGNEAEVFPEFLSRYLGPYSAAFMAGWTLRGAFGAVNGPAVRGGLSAFLEALGAAVVATFSRQSRGRSNRASQSQRDLQSLVRELGSGGDSALRAAAQQIAATQGANARPAKKKSK